MTRLPRHGLIGPEPVALPPATWGSQLYLWANAGRNGLDDSDPVPSFVDLTGNGYSLVQADPAKQPVFYVDEFLGGGYIRFNGSTQYLRTASPALPHPLSFYLLMRLVADTGSNEYYFDAANGNNKDALIYGPGNWGLTRMYAGTNLQIGIWENYVWQILSGTFNGLSSLFAVDRQITNAAGTPSNSGQVGASSGSGLTLGANGVATPSVSSFANIDVADLTLVAGTPTTLQHELQIAYLRHLLPTCLIFVGDSITYGSMATNKNEGFAVVTTDHFKALRSLNAIDLGVSGKTMAQMAADAPAQVAQYVANHRPLSTAVIFGGTNDLVAGATPEATFAATVACCRTWRRVVRVVVGTTLARNAGGFEAKRQTLNSYIKNYWQDFSDGVLLWGDDPNLQNPLDVTYFADGVHPNTTGHALMANSYAIPALPWLA